MNNSALRRLGAAHWMAIAAGVGILIVAIIYGIRPQGDRLGVALRATARWSLMWFFAATTGSALCTLFGERFRAWAQRGRDLGLAFASAHLVHVGLVVRMLVHDTDPYPRSPLIFFGIGVIFTYLLAALTLSGRLRSVLGAKGWRLVRTVGVEYIAYAFLADLWIRSFGEGVINFVIYLPFLSLAIAGPLLRAAALIKRLHAGHAPHAGPAPQH